MTLPTSSRPQQGIFVYRRLEAIAQHLSVRAIRPTPWFPLLCKGPIEPAPRDVSFPIESRRMPYLPGVAKWLDGWWMERCIASWVQEQLAASRPTLLDAHFAYPEGVAVHRVAKRLGLPFIITLRGVEEEWLQFPRIRKQMLEALRSASGVIAVSESLCSVAAAAGIVPSRIHVIGNGCDSMDFHPGCKSKARRQLGIQEDRTVLVSVANVKPVKGHDVIVEALRLRQMQYPDDFEWICIGAEEQPDFVRRIRRQIKDAGLSTRVRFVGPRSPSEVAKYLRSADLFLLASHREGSCNAILEAMACGTPVVATAVGEAPSLARRFRGIRLVPRDDPTELGDAIRATLDGQITMPDSEGRPMPIRSWADVAEECMVVIRQAMRQPDQPLRGKCV